MSSKIKIAQSASSTIQLIRQSLSGKEMDFTSGNIRKGVIILAIPMMLEMLMESVFALVDLYFVGHLEHSSLAIQTVGLTESVLTIIYSIAIGISMAATAIVARRIGEKNAEEAARSGAQAIGIAILITLPLSIAGVFFAKELLLIMGASTAAAEHGKTFTAIMMGSSVSIMLLFLINGIFRGAGNAAIAMKSLWVANIANILLCPLLIRGWGVVPGMGLTGAALATTIGRTIGVVYQCYHLWNGKGKIRIGLQHFRPHLKTIGSIINIATPGILQFVIASCSWIVLARLVAITGGDTASAGYQTALRLMMFFMLPAWGLSGAAATMVGQNLGAGSPGRAASSVAETIKINLGYMLVVSIIFFLMASGLVAFFTGDPAVRSVAQTAMYIMASGFLFYGVGMVMINAFNGAGDTWTPTWINLAGFWFFQIPLAYFLSGFAEMQAAGVFVAIPVSEAAITIASFILFRKGKWKAKEI